MQKVFLTLVLIFVLTQVLGIAVGTTLIGEIASGDLEQPTVVTDNPDDPINAIALIAGILLFTGMLLLFMFLFKGAGLFRVMELFVLFTTSAIVFAAFLPEVALLFAIQLLALRIVLPKNVAIRNIAAIVAVAGVGALIGVTLGVIPVIIFLILLSAYDFIAVFKTKHMVKLAKGISGRNLAFTVAIPTKEHQFELGTGDLVMPLVFAVSVMKSNQAIGFPTYVIPAAFILVASLAGLLLTIGYVKKHLGKALPALPPQAALMIIAWLLTKAIGF
jgi:presenilin-like A22 family membrane protease